MKTKISLFISVILLLVTMVHCSNDDMDSMQQGHFYVKLTDAPSDDAQIQGTFITVSEVKINGKTVEGFSPQTIEVSAYQNGDAKLLLDENVEAGTYNSITLVFDYAYDDEGNSPGCYALTDDNTKHDLESSSITSTEITFNKSFEVAAEGTTSLVVDINLRKSIVRDEDVETDSEYSFVTSAELANSIRIVNEDDCGSIVGNVNNNTSVDGALVVFAYKKGSFNESTETQGDGESNVMFSHAISSAKVENDGSYQLSFLEEGDYEIHLASFEKDEGKLSFISMIEASSLIEGLLLDSISVEANTQVNLNIELLVL